ncbi:MAG TPA: HAD family phosphatase [Pirellulales bacterium]|jgi:HAD superfamily hydrolase (TIGR01549 family)|nr:HAD family phosphatase [Pirellulales bacterium]
MDAPISRPRFLYFDLGNVLILFDHRLACRNLAELTGVPAEQVWELIFAGGLNHRLDAGSLSTAECYRLFCEHFDCRPSPEQFALAASDIFQVNYSMNAVLGRLSGAGYRLGLLSNTSDLHWKYLTDDRYWLIPDAFEQLVLSFEVGLMKPDPQIYRLAAARAGVEPHEVFYVDDLPANVDGALAAGFDAVQYTTTPALVEALIRRGIRINY